MANGEYLIFSFKSPIKLQYLLQYSYIIINLNFFSQKFHLLLQMNLYKLKNKS